MEWPCCSFLATSRVATSDHQVRVAPKNEVLQSIVVGVLLLLPNLCLLLTATVRAQGVQAQPFFLGGPMPQKMTKESFTFLSMYPFKYIYY